ncbi:hypothetical protein [Streptomyces sp. WAC 01325]|uniref:hypothetical protein n=1 Tax=Streptomyces sp. WAC 01325 TaxID=2203202 RepID=UPI0021B06EF7|nr:hypothetical protein [Streptomyces sp. WAC 01325]
MQTVELDLSPVQLRPAGQRWGEAPGLKLHHTDAIAYLQGDEEPLDAAYPVYGGHMVHRPRPEHGFTGVRARVLEAQPGTPRVGTLIVEARTSRPWQQPACRTPPAQVPERR